jgi:hypothetical protein
MPEERVHYAIIAKRRGNLHQIPFECNLTTISTPDRTSYPFTCAKGITFKGFINGPGRIDWKEGEKCYI